MARTRLFHYLFLPLGALLLASLGGCASTVPAPIRTAPAGNPPLSAVRADSGRYVGQAVRWGGTIAAVTNGTHNTTLEVVQRPLHADGEPKETDRSEGRFLVRVTRFLDPAIYAKGRRVTVMGKITGQVTRNVGQYPYPFIQLDASYLYLWPRELPLSSYNRPYFYDPWYYNPWYYPAPPYPWR